jgi:antitoxin component YwqK of YwqJK toxin-antitoxin module
MLDDGDVEFYYVNGEPRFSFLHRHESDKSSFLSDTENDILNASYIPKGIIKYDIVFVNHWEDGVIEKWIEDSKELEKENQNDKRRTKSNS